MLEINQLKEQLETMKEIYHTEKGKKDSLDSIIEEKRVELNKANEDKEFYTELLILLQESSNNARKQSVDSMEKLVTNPLQYIFGENTSFKIDMKPKGENSTAKYVVVTENSKETVEVDPRNDGGGSGDICALSILSSLNLSSGTNITAPLLLDEPTKYVSDGHRLKAAHFVKELSESFDKQIIMSTHDIDIAGLSDKAYFFNKVDGVSNITEMTEDFIIP